MSLGVFASVAPTAHAATNVVTCDPTDGQTSTATAKPGLVNNATPDSAFGITSISITFQGINPKTNKLATATSTVKSALASYSQATPVPLAIDMVSQPVSNSKSLFFTKVANVHVTIDEDATARAMGCAAKGGLKVMHLNNTPGTLTIS